MSRSDALTHRLPPARWRVRRTLALAGGYVRTHGPRDRAMCAFVAVGVLYLSVAHQLWGALLFAAIGWAIASSVDSPRRRCAARNRRRPTRVAAAPTGSRSGADSHASRGSDVAGREPRGRALGRP